MSSQRKKFEKEMESEVRSNLDISGTPTELEVNDLKILKPESICDFVTVNIFTPDECNKLIEYCKKRYALSPSTLDKGTTINEDIRYSNNGWLKRTDENLWWVHDRIKDVVMTINEMKFNYDITSSEQIQFTEYGCGHHYTWHHDMGEHDSSNKRKLSITVELSDGSTYNGGKLMLLTMGNHYNIIEPKQGQATIFSSFTPHIVTEVTPKAGSS